MMNVHFGKPVDGWDNEKYKYIVDSMFKKNFYAKSYILCGPR